MTKRISFIVYLAVAFVALSVILYAVHYLIFHDLHHIFIFMVGDLAFLPLEVLLVSLIIERVLARREKHQKLQKLNMVIGAFFSEAGNFLLRYLLNGFHNRTEISRDLNIRSDWTKKEFHSATDAASRIRVEVDWSRTDLEKLKPMLREKRTFLLTLLENPNLLEHDHFTDLLWAVTHLDEELEARTTFDDMPETDRAHIAVDIQRLYANLAIEWLEYAEHLKSNYPFLFSLILRTHPFQESPSAVVRG